MLTLMFFIAVLAAIPVLIFVQPSGRRTIFEPGVLIIELFALCYLLPALAIMSGADILPIENEDNVETISLYGFLFVVSFVSFYLLLKSSSRWHIFPAPNINISWHSNKCLLGFVTFFVITKMITGYYGVGDSAEYAQQYIVRAAMPPIVNQMIVLFQSLQWMFVYLLLASSLSGSARAHSMRYVSILFIVFASEMWLTNARSNFVTFCIVFMAAYIFFKRPIGLLKEVLLATFFVVVIGIFAFKRLDPERVVDVNLLDILIPGEFASVYGNAIHWVSMLGTPDLIEPPTSSYLQSLIAFVPKQFNEEKWDLAGWYVTQYFPEYAEAGGGLAFGIIPEAIVNWGLLSIVFQAFVLSAIFRIAYYSAFANRSRDANIWVLFYLFSFSQIYQVIRSHSFSIISGTVLGFVVPFLLLFLLSRIRFSLKRSMHA